MRSGITLTIMAMVALATSACMPELEKQLESLADRQPKVVEVTPVDGTEAPQETQVTIRFSLPIEPASVDMRAIAVIEKGEEDSARAIAEKLDAEELTAIEGAYTVSDDGTEVMFIAETTYDAGKEYAVVVTDKLYSKDLIPFNQTPGREPTPFTSMFAASGEGAESSMSAEGTSGASGSGGTSSSGGSDGGDEGGSTTTTAKVRPSWLVVNEMLYDVVGSDTNGDVFIELAGEASTEVSGYKIAFVNGSDGKIYDTIDVPEGSFISARGLFVIADAVTGSPGTSHVVDAQLIVNFDPQNGPDALQLLDSTGALIDCLGYGSPQLATAENGMQSYEGTPSVTASGGASLSRTDAQDTGDNATDFVKLTTPTPGN